MKNIIKKEALSIIFNIIIVILVVLGTAFMLTGFQFMMKEDSLTATRLEAFKYFTVDSNILMGIASAIFVAYEIGYIKGKIEIIPTKVYIFKLVATVGVLLTFIVTACFLAPTAIKGFFSLYLNSNLFFHLIIPILSFLTFVFFESSSDIKFRYSFMGLIPILVYALFYLINCITHIEEGIISYKYDWYGFLGRGTNSIAIVFSIIIIATYFICFLLWILNRRGTPHNNWTFGQ